MNKKLLLSSKNLKIIINRLACQLKEFHGDFKDSVIVGLQPRGLVLSKSIKKILEEQHEIQNLKINFLDITFHRDDFRRDKVLNPNFNNMENDIEGKKIILIDDVLYTGRSVRSALSALDYYGRPSKIQLLVLIDRRFARHLPIQPDFSGRQVDAIQNEKVFVNLSADDKKNSVYIINQTNE
ncbi:MAG: bifunctional pyr operon transcriptional regulator/uracil phosphoribosyltransferase PyrR [Bacteroidota bacterium]|nr:bifunctional pyr operon transcriptional regulator/uracil phosphoribosyltransferase PyrR [Bacteroidota bacterium]